MQVAPSDRVADKGAETRFTLEVASLFSGVARRVIKGTFSLDADESDNWSRYFDVSPAKVWSNAMFARVAVLAVGTRVAPSAVRGPLVEEVFRTGDEGEKQSVLQALPFLPNPGVYAELSAEAVRSNTLSIVGALGLDNAYTAQELPEPAFEQMILKMLIVGLPISRVLGLSARTTPSLQRKVLDYVSECHAAGRDVPRDTGFICPELA